MINILRYQNYAVNKYSSYGSLADVSKLLTSIRCNNIYIDYAYRRNIQYANGDFEIDDESCLSDMIINSISESKYRYILMGDVLYDVKDIENVIAYCNINNIELFILCSSKKTNLITSKCNIYDIVLVDNCLHITNDGNTESFEDWFQSSYINDKINNILITN